MRQRKGFDHKVLERKLRSRGKFTPLVYRAYDGLGLLPGGRIGIDRKLVASRQCANTLDVIVVFMRDQHPI
jgi:hypothetical protein